MLFRSLQRLISIADASNVYALAEQQRDYASRRKLVEIAGSIDRAARDFGVHALETGNIALQAIDDIMAAARVKRTWRTAGEAMREVMDYLLTDKTDLSMTTGFQGLDRVIGGWRRKQFAILAGRPSMGKSTVALGSLLRTAQQGVGVVLFSLEMDRVSMMARCVSDLAWSGAGALLVAQGWPMPDPHAAPGAFGSGIRRAFPPGHGEHR